MPTKTGEYGMKYVPQKSPQKLRDLAVWYREYAERAGNSAIWDARLRTAEDLEKEASSIERRREIRFVSETGRTDRTNAEKTRDMGVEEAKGTALITDQKRESIEPRCPLRSGMTGRPRQ
jgi:hypothetical protein